MREQFRLAGLVIFAACVILSAAAFLSSRSFAQQPSPQNAGQELVADIAAGRVVIAVVKDAILIGTIENPIEAETHPPIPVETESYRAGIILGAVDWFSPSSQQDIARLDKELPHLKATLIRSGAQANAPTLGKVQGNDEAADIEATGLGFQQRLSQVAEGLHAKVSLPEDDPLAELIVADYLPGYGPEVWQISYAMKQEEERDGYWETNVAKPVYLQLWPPEKGQPKTLVEFNYPPEGAPPTLLEMLRQKDPRLEAIRNSDPQMALVVSGLLQGDSMKLYATDTTQFLRAALAAIGGPKSRQTMAAIVMDKGFAWVLPPPAEAERPKPAQPQGPAQASQPGERPADAPSLLKH